MEIKEEEYDMGPTPMEVDHSHMASMEDEHDEMIQLRHECQQLREHLAETQNYVAAMERSRDHYKAKADVAETNLAQRIGDDYDDAKNLREERDRLLQDRQAGRDRLHHLRGQLYSIEAAGRGEGGVRRVQEDDGEIRRRITR